MSQQLICITDTSVAIAAQAEEIKSQALAVAGMVPDDITTVDKRDEAVEAQRALKEVALSVEKARQEAKEPFFQMGKRIDLAAKTFVAEVETELTRITRAVGNYEQVQLAKQRAAEAARRLEEEKARQYAEAEQRRVREEAEAQRRELDRQTVEAARAAQAAANAEERKRAEALQVQIDAQKAKAEAETMDRLEQIDERTCDQIAAIAPAIEAPSRATGQRIEEIAVIDSIDAFILLKARPDLVRKIEWDQVQLKSELLALGAGEQIKGVKWHKEVKSTTTSRRNSVINV